ncbi:hypothetical protein DMC47_27155 [Nostoc sp. 3335mG]|nr:hypothetical protein DMC47_27155 [Nostoc sp. 3335mG]
MLDAIVVGTGPGGALAALRLAEAGAKLLVLEKRKLPRDKACGGALTVGPVKALLGWDFSHLVEAHVDQSLWQLDFGTVVERDFGYGAWMIDRRTFDLHILERALAAGGSNIELRDDCGVEAVTEEADGVTVTLRGGETVRARYLIGGDGAAGRTAAALGLGRRTRPALAIDAHIEPSEEAWALEGKRMSFNFGVVPGGYGWIFPKKGYLSCGVGSWTRATGLPGLLDTYLEQALPPGAVRGEVRRGHPIPIYDGPVPISTRRACLVGDAASLVEPILGEGIRFALASGAIAAAVIAEKLAGTSTDPDGLDHSRRVHREIGRDLDRLRRFVLPIFLNKPESFFRNFLVEEGNYMALAAALEAKLPAPEPFPLQSARA